MRRSFKAFLKTASVLLAIWLLPTAVPVGAVTLDDLHRTESQLNSTKAKIREGEVDKSKLNAEIKTADDRLDSLQAELERVNSQVGKAREAKNNITAKLNSLRAELAKTQVELDKAKARLKKLTRSLNNRAESVYKNGGVSFLEVLLSATDFSNFLSRSRFLEAIINLDAALVKNIKTTKRTIENARADIKRAENETAEQEKNLEAEVNRLENLQASQVAKKNEIQASTNSKKQLIVKINQDRETWLAAEAEFERSATRIREQLARARSAPVIGNPSVSGFVWPVNGPVTSGFGLRWGRRHEGVDIAVPAGTPVAASKAGKIVIADWYGGYGKLVVVDHGGGVTTWYGHNSKLTVRVGQKVGQGSVIAKSGSTGNSTGPHVHFEVRINGNPQNPLRYLP